uniref:Uncharacterized protein n=1 Tax=Knipowitschia caucasica TaxID=637954 RepID=A0AAV2K9X8_KNICA
MKARDEEQIDRWALTVRVTLAEGWSKELGLGEAAACCAASALSTAETKISISSDRDHMTPQTPHCLVFR